MISDTFETGWTVKRNTESVDSGGAVTSSWADNADIEAHIRKLSGDEIDARSKDEHVATHRVYAEATVDVTVKDRLVSPDGEVFNVVSVDNPHELDEFLQIDVIRTDAEAVDDE